MLNNIDKPFINIVFNGYRILIATSSNLINDLPFHEMRDVWTVISQTINSFAPDFVSLTRQSESMTLCLKVGDDMI